MKKRKTKKVKALTGVQRGVLSLHTGTRWHGVERLCGGKGIYRHSVIRTHIQSQASSFISGLSEDS